MKPTKLVIHNIGIIPDAGITIDKPLLAFYGSLMQGKSTILHCVEWVCGGSFPSDILRHGTKEGYIELQFGKDFLRREFYLARDGKTIKARSLTFVRDGRPVDDPTKAVKELLNPFSLDQDYLIRKNETDRAKYFVELFGVNTSDIDAALVIAEKDAAAMRSELKGYGEIDLTEHKPVDVAALNGLRAEIVADAEKERAALEQTLDSINRQYERQLAAVRLEISSVNQKNMEIELNNLKLADVQAEIHDLEIKLGRLKEHAKSLQVRMEKNTTQPAPSEPTPPDTTELKRKILTTYTPDTAAIDAKLSDAAAANVRAEQCQKNLAREQERLSKAKKLTDLESAIKTKREDKIAQLSKINESCTIEGLKFNTEGEFAFQGTSAAMLSTSQLMLLSSKLSDLYPPGLGISIIDKAESLGSSIFKLIDRAKVEDKTILAAVVGERPAVVPEQVGVFIVDGGRVSQ
jgi:hypothetical protein